MNTYTARAGGYSSTLPFKAYWLHDAPAGLTFNNSTFCPHSIMCFVFISEQTATSA
jgi:hypothetical protein